MSVLALLLTVKRKVGQGDFSQLHCLKLDLFDKVWELKGPQRLNCFGRCTNHFLLLTMALAGHMILPNNKGAGKCGRALIDSYHIFGIFKFLVQFHTVSHEQRRCGLLTSFNQERGRKKASLLKTLLLVSVSQWKEIFLPLWLGTMKTTNNV